MAKPGEPHVKYDIQDLGDYLVVHLSGDVDLYSSPHAREVILNCLDQNKNLLIEMSGVVYIDSSGVASLVEGYQISKNKNLEFGLVSVSENAINVLQLAHLDKVFPIHDSLEAKLQSGNAE